MSDKSSFPIGTLVLAAGLVLLMVLTYLLVKPKSPPAELQGILKPQFRMLAPFQLQVHARAPITEADLKGKWSFVFFGYTHCPDVCPNTLHELNRFRRLLDDQDENEKPGAQIIFVSVDPARDSTERLASYTAHFHDSFIGATAGKAAIDRLVRQFGAGYILEPETAAGQYLVTHTGAIFLVDPYGRLIAAFSQPHYAKTILTQFGKIVDYYEGAGQPLPAAAG